MPQLDANAVATRWANNLAASTQKITASVNALTTSPTSQAANAAQTWLARLNDPATVAKFQKNLNRVTLQQWQTAMTQKGIPRIGQGAQQAVQTKMLPFYTAWLPYEAQGQQQVKAMPKGTLQDRIARAVFMINWNHQWPGR